MTRFQFSLYCVSPGGFRGYWDDSVMYIENWKQPLDKESKCSKCKELGGADQWKTWNEVAQEWHVRLLSYGEHSFKQGCFEDIWYLTKRTPDATSLVMMIMMRTTTTTTIMGFSSKYEWEVHIFWHWIICKLCYSLKNLQYHVQVFPCASIHVYMCWGGTCMKGSIRWGPQSWISLE